MSGRKVVGCCVHVAAVISFLSYEKYFFTSPKAQFLNEVFIDMEKKQKPNQPNYVRNKRKKQIKYQIDIKTKSFVATQEIINDNYIIPKKSNQIFLSLNHFKKKIPHWGAVINYNGLNGIKVVNTCSIDYFLLTLWCYSKINRMLFEQIQQFKITEYLKIIINQIDLNKWDYARELWINKVMQLKKKVSRNTISLFGSENDMFIKFLSEIQNYKLIQICDENCVLNKNTILRENSENIFFLKINNEVKIDNQYNYQCDFCKKQIIYDIEFYKKPDFLFIQSKYPDIFVKDLPKEIIVDKNKYKFFNTTIYHSDHFMGIFEIENKLYFVNDLGQKICSFESDSNKEFFQNYPTSNSFYYLI